MKKKGIFIFIIATAVVWALTPMSPTSPSLKRTRLGRIVRWFFLDGGMCAQRANDLAEDIEKKIGAEKLQTWCEETMTRYKTNELLTDGNSPYWSFGSIKLADEEIPVFIKNVWPKRLRAGLQEPDVSVTYNGDCIAISWYLHGILVGPKDYVENGTYWYLRQVKPGVYVYGVEK